VAIQETSGRGAEKSENDAQSAFCALELTTTEPKRGGNRALLGESLSRSRPLPTKSFRRRNQGKGIIIIVIRLVSS